MIGSFVLVRTHSAGVHCGVLEEINGMGMGLGLCKEVVIDLVYKM